MKKILSLAILALLICQMTILSSFAQTNNAKFIPLKASQIDSNCNLTNSINVDKEAFNIFEQKVGGKFASLKNDFFNVKGNKLQINYIEAVNSENTEKIYNTLVKKVGNYNVIAQKGNTVIEIISSDKTIKDKLLEIIKPGKVHKNY